MYAGKLLSLDVCNCRRNLRGNIFININLSPKKRSIPGKLWRDIKLKN